ncbi:MAG: Asp-tRNA(Asn)/Glu-tRNA(Gln) amidotransferase GatCAB subunit B, partial [Alphaproteobacteria bacterium]|nr:Asp-tRNA(Asn)/Glu-tRNA(Gln) amidotransferase GatCAB subunit B [Alphaproteobacteria bacterium]
RYFPDPDLLPLELSPAWINEIARSLPELPDQKKVRFIGLGLSSYDAAVLVAEKETADYFEAMLAEDAEPKAAANWLNNEVFGRLNKAGVSVLASPVSPAQNAAILRLLKDNVISGKIAKDLLDIVWDEGGDPYVIVNARGLRQMSDASAIERMVDAVIKAHPDKVEEVRKKPKLTGWFVGQVMKQSGGKANPQAVNDIVKARLGIGGQG